VSRNAKKTEGKLHGGEGRFETIIARSPIPLVVTDANGDIEFFNDKFTELFGYVLDDVSTSEEWWLAAYPDENYRQRVRDSWETAVAEAMSNGTQIETQEWSITCKDGSLRRVEFDMMPLGDISVIAMKDITDRKQLENALRESEDKYRALFEQAGDSIILIDPEAGKIVEFNDRTCLGLGYSRDEFEKLSLPDLDVAETMEQVVNHIEKVVKDGSDGWEAQWRAKDGGIRTYSVNARAITIREKTFVASILTDMTERKQAERRLQRAETELKHTIEVVPGIIARANVHSGYVTHCNPALTSILGFSSEEFMSRPFVEFVHPDDRQKTIDEVAGQLKGIPVATFENRYLCKDGSYKWLEWRATAADENGVVYCTATDVTDRKAAEKALQESEDKWSSLAKNAPNFFTVVDPDHLIEYINHPVSGLDMENVIGASVYGFVQPEYHTLAREKIESVFATGNACGFESIAAGPDGTLSYYDNRLGPILTNGLVSSVSIIASDITVRRNIEESLQRRTHDLGERVKELNCLRSLSILTNNPDKSLNDVLKEAVALIPPSWQYPEITFARIVFDVSKFETQGYRETPWKQSARIVVSGVEVGSLDVIYAQEKAEIDEGPFLAEERHLLDGLAREIGKFIERRNTQDALKRSETEFRTIVETAPSMFIINDADGRNLYVSPNCVKMTGYTPDEILRDSGRWIHDDDSKRYSELFERTFAKGVGFRGYEYRAVRKSGETWYASSSWEPLRGDRGELIGGVFQTMDVSERRRSEQLLREGEEKHRLELMKVDRLASVGRLAAGVAHEINNPMAVLYGMVQELDEEPESCTTEITRDMLRVSRRIRTVVNKLLTFSRQTEVEKTIVDLNEVIDNTLTLLSSQLKKSAVEVVKNLEPAAPLAVANADQIQQVLMDLIFNAIDAMPNGGQLRIDLKSIDHKIGIIIEDNGQGIESGDIDKIFLPFFTTKEVGKGTGLGLSVAYGIIEDHGGKVSVASKVGSGSRFAITLPAAPA
jgi:PAS domain S-box-containing protein